MTFAFLSDIHANLPALQSALRVTNELKANRVIVAGDILGDGDDPSGTVDLLRNRAAYAVRGNVDREVLALGDDAGLLEDLAANDPSPRTRDRARTALALDDRQRKWLRSLAGSTVFHVGEAVVMVAHGSPKGDTDYIYPSITPEALAEKLDGHETPDVLVVGHSHVPFVRRINGILVVNCGSVGRPVDGDPRGALAVVEFIPGVEVMASIVRFDFLHHASGGHRGVRGVESAIQAGVRL